MRLGSQVDKAVALLNSTLYPVPFGKINFAEDKAEMFYQEVMAQVNQGSLTAQYWLGVCYAEGCFVEKDERTAVEWFQKAAEQGFVLAQSALGCCYMAGDGVEADQNEAFKWMRKAAEQGDAMGQIALGLFYEFGMLGHPDTVEAIKWYQKATDQGFEVEQRALVEINPKFFEFVQKQAERGEEKAQQFLDSCEASEVAQCREAAKQGHLPSEFLLACHYLNGTGVEQDEREAFKWMKKAAEHEHEEAPLKLALFYLKGVGVEADEKEAFKWMQKAAEQGHIEAQLELALFYLKGVGVDVDREKGLKWLRIAAEHGHFDAQLKMAICYLHGFGVDADEQEAFKWLQKAVEQGYAGNTEAQVALVDYYFSVKDIEEAIKWMQIIAEHRNDEAQHFFDDIREEAGQGDAGAQFQLGIVYSKGISVNENKAEAIKWFQKSAEQGYEAAQQTLDMIR